ncbi:C10 family peptidase [bacterium]|nr:C10 family peptidase [bacterium]
MFKKTFIALFLLIAVITWADNASFEEINKIAQTHLEIEGKGDLSQFVPIMDSESKIAYIALLEPQGYIVIPTIKELRPIIAYSFDSDFDVIESRENFPLAIIKLDIQNRIQAIPQTPSGIIRRNQELWSEYIESSPRLLTEMTTGSIWGPYTDTRWNQGDPYNIFCPIDPETGEICPIGCVVTAMGQIVNYWEWPPNIAFDTTYNYISEATEPPIYIDAPTANIDTVDYNAVGVNPDDTTRARLLFALGVSIEMKYKDGGSAAASHDVAISLVDKLGYLSADGIMSSSPSFYTDILLDIMNQRAPYMSIHSPEVGHGVVVDGYRESGEFHVNFGWGGTADAWYFLPDSLPSDLTIVDYGIVNITPPVITHRAVENLTSDAITGGHVMLRWEAPLHITEPVVHYNIYRKHIDSPDWAFLSTTYGLNYMDRYPPELKELAYGVIAVYAEDVESRVIETVVITEVHDGWNRVITFRGDETPWDIAPNGSGGFVVIGSRDFSAESGIDIFLVNIGVSGDTIWTKTYGGAEDEYGYTIEATSDGGYIAAGATESFGAGGSDIWLLKLDSMGDTIWTETYGTSGDERACDITISSGGGYAIVGSTNPSGENLLYYIKTDLNGLLQWEQSYTGFVGNSICELGSYFYIGGYYNTGPLGNHDAMLLKTDALGDSLWTKPYGGANADEINSIIPSSDGGIVMAGITRSFGIPLFTSIFLVKATADGDTVFTNHLGGMNDFSAEKITAVEEGFITIGTTVNSGNKDVFLLYIDELGDTIKTHTYGTAATDLGYGIIALEDSSIALAGRTYSDSTNNFWLMKIGGPVSPVEENILPSKPKDLNIFAYPNPFNSSVQISVKTQNPASTQIEIFDIAGRFISKIDDAENLAPTHNSIANQEFSETNGGSQTASTTSKFTWTPNEKVVSGVYLVRAQLKNGQSITKRMIYLK